MMDILDDFFPEDENQETSVKVNPDKIKVITSQGRGKPFMRITTKGEVLIELMEEFSEGHTAPQEEAYSKAKTLLEEFQEIMGSGIFDALKEVADLTPVQIVEEILAWDKERNQTKIVMTEEEYNNNLAKIREENFNRLKRDEAFLIAASKGAKSNEDFENIVTAYHKVISQLQEKK